MNEPMIIKCNRMFSDEELEEFREKWNNQASANEVIVLPPGFELAKNKIRVELLLLTKNEAERREQMTLELIIIAIILLIAGFSFGFIMGIMFSLRVIERKK